MKVINTYIVGHTGIPANGCTQTHVHIKLIK